MSKFSFLIVGAGRGGTSLLAAILDTHSLLEVGFEKYSVQYLMNPQKCWLKNELLCRTSRFLKACEKEARSSRNPVWGNKITSEQIAGLHDVAEGKGEEDVWRYFFERMLKNQKVIFILRDGRSCIPSKMKRAGLSLDDALERWKYSVRMSQYLERSHPNSYILKYEELLLNPDQKLQSVCSFLGIHFEAGMVEGTENPKMLEEYRQKGLDKNKALSPVKKLEWHHLIQKELSELNYI